MAQIIHEGYWYQQQWYENFRLLGVAHKHHSSQIVMPCGSSPLLSAYVSEFVFSSVEVGVACMKLMHRQHSC